MGVRLDPTRNESNAPIIALTAPCPHSPSYTDEEP